MTGLRPRTFLGHPGFQFDYDHLGGDEVERRGRAVGAIIDGRLYLALLRRAPGCTISPPPCPNSSGSSKARR